MLTIPTLTVAQVADVLGVHPGTVRRWITKGDLEVTQMGGDRGPIRVPVRALVALLEATGRRTSADGLLRWVQSL